MGIAPPHSPTLAPHRRDADEIAIYDDFLDHDHQRRILDFVSGPGWSYGAFSDPSPGASRYFYKHFAGIVRDGRETCDPSECERRLTEDAPAVAGLWALLRDGLLAGHALSRCYANGYPAGTEGGLHTDSNIPSHFTTIYYPHLAWHPNFAGETVFFDREGSDVIASVYPKPNRLVVFPGVIPHVARGVSRVCPHLRITLMIKSAPAQAPQFS